MADDAPVGEHTAAIEAWLATSAFEQAKDTAYTMARGGSGSFDRNISPEVLERVVVDLHQRLPAGLMVPAPDRDFIDTALAQVLPDISQVGIADLTELTTAVQVVFIQLAAAADMLMELQQSDPERLAALVEDA